MSKVIAFSGGCFSGKTTTTHIVKKELEDRGHKVVILGEIIRNVTDKPIDILRKDASAYLVLQDKIIREKMAMENEAFGDQTDIIYLVDRAITDSLFYLQNYVDKSSLSENEMLKFCALHKDIVNHAKNAFVFGYDMLIEFIPIDGTNDDKFRPSIIDVSKEYEFEAIAVLNSAFVYNKLKYHRFNANTDDTRILIEKILCLDQMN